MLSSASHSCHLISQKEPANPLCEIVMHSGCYALSTAASFTLLRYLVVFFLSHLEYVFLLLSKKRENYFATALIGYTDRGSIKWKWYLLYAYVVVCLVCLYCCCVCLMCCRQAYHSPCFGHHQKGGDCWTGEPFIHKWRTILMMSTDLGWNIAWSS